MNIQVFCNKAIKFRHNDDQEVTATVRPKTFESVPSWITKTDMFDALVRDNDIRVIQNSGDLKEVETDGKILADKADELNADYVNMSNKKLYDACIENGIEVEEKMKKSYYLEKLGVAVEADSTEE